MGSKTIHLDMMSIGDAILDVIIKYLSLQERNLKTSSVNLDGMSVAQKG